VSGPDRGQVLVPGASTLACTNIPNQAIALVKKFWSLSFCNITAAFHPRRLVGCCSRIASACSGVTERQRTGVLRPVLLSSCGTNPREFAPTCPPVPEELIELLRELVGLFRPTGRPTARATSGGRLRRFTNACISASRSLR